VVGTGLPARGTGAVAAASSARHRRRRRPPCRAAMRGLRLLLTLAVMVVVAGGGAGTAPGNDGAVLRRWNAPNALMSGGWGKGQAACDRHKPVVAVGGRMRWQRRYQ